MTAAALMLYRLLSLYMLVNIVLKNDSFRILLALVVGRDLLMDWFARVRLYICGSLKF